MWLLRTVRVEVVEAKKTRKSAVACGWAVIAIASLAAAFPLWGAPFTGPTADALLLFTLLVTSVTLVHVYVASTRPSILSNLVPNVGVESLQLEGPDDLELKYTDVEACWLEDRDVVVATAGERVLRIRTGHVEDARELAASIRLGAHRSIDRLPLDLLAPGAGAGLLYAMSALSFVIGCLWIASLADTPSPLLQIVAPLSFAAVGVVILRRARPHVLVLGPEGIADGARVLPYREIVDAQRRSTALVLTSKSGAEVSIDVGRPTSAEAIAAELLFRHESELDVHVPSARVEPVAAPYR